VTRLVASTRRDTGAVFEQGERMLIPCDGGPSQYRLAHWPPPLEVIERDGMYILIDDGPPEQWRYEFVPNEIRD
jgi:hypothetical protein